MAMADNVVFMDRKIERSGFGLYPAIAAKLQPESTLMNGYILLI
jgi:hypothetical protein